MKGLWWSYVVNMCQQELLLFWFCRTACSEYNHSCIEMLSVKWDVPLIANSICASREPLSVCVCVCVFWTIILSYCLNSIFYSYWTFNTTVQINFLLLWLRWVHVSLRWRKKDVNTHTHTRILHIYTLKASMQHRDAATELKSSYSSSSSFYWTSPFKPEQ